MNYSLIRLCDSINPCYDISRIDSGSPQRALPSENNTDDKHDRTYTLAEAFDEAKKDGYRIIVYVPDGKFYYLKGKDKTIEKARASLLLASRNRVCCILSF